MATKTLSVDEEAYRILAKARSHPGESFSKVIKRASWNQGGPTCSRLLDRVSPGVPEEWLDNLDEIQLQDSPAQDKWNA